MTAPTKASDESQGWNMELHLKTPFKKKRRWKRTKAINFLSGANF